MRDVRDRSAPAPLVSVVVVAWNAGEALRACLGSLAAQNERDFEVVVVDNGSQDGSAAWVARQHPGVRLVALAQNTGFAEGCNRGIAAARGRWIATLNDDARPDAEWLASLARVARAAPATLGMLQSRILRLERPGELASTGVELAPDGCFADRDAGRPVGEGASGPEVFCPSAAAALYRREMLDQVTLSTGVFDRGYFAYFEDVDLGWRCRLAGWEARYVPEATVLHAEHASARRREPGFLEKQCRRNRIGTLLKNASAGLLVRAAPQLVRDALAEARFGPGELGAWLGAARAGLRQRGEVGRRLRIARVALERRALRAARGPRDPGSS